MKKQKRLVLVGGGTAGHIMPTLAVGFALAKIEPDLRLYYFGSGRPADRKLFQASGLKADFYAVSSGKLRRYFDIRNFFDLFNIFAGLIQSLILLATIRPDHIFIRGSAVGLIVGRAAKLIGIPYSVHESDVVFSLTTRHLASGANKVFVSWPAEEVRRYNAQKLQNTELTGLPVSEDYFHVQSKQKPGRVLVVGGSQGSTQINTLVKEILDQGRLPQGLVLYHQTGAGKVGDFLKYEGDTYKPFEFTDHLPQDAAEAEVIVSRASSFILEVAVIGRPLILIPLPAGVDGNMHQHGNAESAEKLGAAIYLKEPVTSEGLVEAIERVLSDKDLQKSMSANLKRLSKPHAAADIAQALIGIMKS